MSRAHFALGANEGGRAAEDLYGRGLQKRPLRMSDLTSTQRQMTQAAMIDKTNQYVLPAEAGGRGWGVEPGLVLGHTVHRRAMNLVRRMHLAAQNSVLLPVPLEHDVPREHLAGEGFYFEHARNLWLPEMNMGGFASHPTFGMDTYIPRSASGRAADEFNLITSASARMSPRTAPYKEEESSRAIYKAHIDPEANIFFDRSLVQRMHQTWEKAWQARLTNKEGEWQPEWGEKPPKGGGLPMAQREGEDIAKDAREWGALPELINAHAGKVMHISQVHPRILDLMATKEVRPVAAHWTRGDVDYPGINRVSLGENIRSGIGVIQGDVAEHPDPHGNPKQFGYKFSTYHALFHPGSDLEAAAIEAEYRHRAQIIGEILSGKRKRGDPIDDIYGMHHVNEGMLSNRAIIASDVWTKGAMSGLPYPAANKVGNDALSKVTVDLSQRPQLEAQAKKEGFNYRPQEKGWSIVHPDYETAPHLTGLSLEHAIDQQAIEHAAKKLQQMYDLPFSVPTRLIQETGGWGQPRRASGRDPDFNRIGRRMP